MYNEVFEAPSLLTIKTLLEQVRRQLVERTNATPKWEWDQVSIGNALVH